jgi:hypothetical protein
MSTDVIGEPGQHGRDMGKHTSGRDDGGHEHHGWSTILKDNKQHIAYHTHKGRSSNVVTTFPFLIGMQRDDDSEETS